MDGRLGGWVSWWVDEWMDVGGRERVCDYIVKYNIQ